MTRMQVALRTVLVAALLPPATILGAAPASADVRALAIGDSVMLGAKWALTKRDIAVDAVVSRQASSGPGIVKRRAARLPTSVVIHLGTNGTLRPRDCHAVMAGVGETRTVYWMTIAAKRSWVPGNNRVIRACVRAYPGRTVLIDWAAATKNHPEWLYADGIHLRPTGARAYARLVANALQGGPVTASISRR